MIILSVKKFEHEGDGKSGQFVLLWTVDVISAFFCPS